MEAPAATREPEEPTVVGGHPVVRVLGRGGMGKVYACRDDALDRVVAAKVLLPELRGQQEMSARFVREARAMAKVSSPHVVTVFAVGEDEGLPYLVMELLDGEDLSAKLKREGPLPIDVALSYALDAARGLAAAAGAGLVHRDVKPANLFLVGGRVKLTDFGLARPVDGSADLTQAGLVVGTPYYLAPELARGQAGSVASDVYALGATLYEMLVGRPPYEGESALDVLTAHLMQPIPDVGAMRPDASPALAALVTRMLQKKPDQRVADYDTLLASLQELLDDARAKSSSSATLLKTPLPASAAPSDGGAASALFAPATGALPAPLQPTGVSATPAGPTGVIAPSPALSSSTKPLPAARVAALLARLPGAPAPGLAVAALVGLVLLVVVVAALSGGDRRDRIADGEAREVLAEIEGIPSSDRTPQDEADRGHALWALERRAEAYKAWLVAAKGGVVDGDARDLALSALQSDAPSSAAIDMLGAWPDASVEGDVRDLLKSSAYETRHAALDVLHERGTEDDDAKQRVGLQDLAAEKCEHRRAGLRLLKKAGRGDATIAAVKKMRPTGGLGGALGSFLPGQCGISQMDIDDAVRAIEKRTNG